MIAPANSPPTDRMVLALEGLPEAMQRAGIKTDNRVENPSKPAIAGAGPSPVQPIEIDGDVRLPLLRVSEIWRYRELLYYLVWRDFKVRYKQTMLGAAWAILQPLMMMVVFNLFL